MAKTFTKARAARKAIHGGK